MDFEDDSYVSENVFSKLKTMTEFELQDKIQEFAKEIQDLKLKLSCRSTNMDEIAKRLKNRWLLIDLLNMELATRNLEPTEIECARLEELRRM